MIKNKYGQYFTPEEVANFMVDLADIDSKSKIMEPSCGEGIFIKILRDKGYQDITAYEIDRTLSKDLNCVTYESFITASIIDKYDLIIGNPPYIRWKNLEEELKLELKNNILWNRYFNSLCDYLYIFILKSILLLKEGGQLIFICPEYWMNTTHSISLRNFMIENGYFERIIHFNETPIFENARVSIMIFKYIKSTTKKKDNIHLTKYFNSKRLDKNILDKIFKQEVMQGVDYLDISHFETNKRWLLENNEVNNLLDKFMDQCCSIKNGQYELFETEDRLDRIGDICDIGNGMVSGLDKAFQINPMNLNKKELNKLLPVIKAKNLESFKHNGLTTYIYLDDNISEEELKESYPNFYANFQDFKDALERRYQYNRKINYWEWVFKRNLNLFSRAENRIFVPCKERISNKDYFRFALVDKRYYPTQDVTAIFRKAETKESLEYIVAFLNTKIVFDWLRNYGIVKGNIVEFSEAPIASIPFRKINWDQIEEVKFHNQITELVKKSMTDSTLKIKELIDKLFNDFLKLQ